MTTEWRPIETAPMDDSEETVLVYIPEIGTVPARWSGSFGWSVGPSCGGDFVWPDETEPTDDGQPTHWMPLPAPPESE